MIFVLSMLLLFVLFLLFVFYLVNFLISIKDNSKNKISAFESGFVSVGKIQNSFSIHFFIMMLMFVIFDLEIVMFLGVLVSDMSSFVSFLLLFVFILSGFYMEWWYGKLVWLV
uniref:NADH-ubiquinone oxidoreductase chain 3 n=2 Tax=Heterorhabditis TaxID=37861 RepID=A0A309_HETBA|nr:NADH dehydrogenase subunit 3 [Heterorhabditis indica]YP_817456.1 NADH dehydrogenase subunit 3 [Heterorhabditis bacteriophora]ABJ80700.1 NADH dehydrogenase subunit 3 [Heterorhabditis bacteriophora]AZU95941.1 NADH dehydrogenase subunit 3 [Heterorhabditis bacteriophora]QAA11086.1 NADH dehydrogenase subunit 3 [Heterorhabditis indica]QAA11098.1 NADH dehydrogenase subunit 3 [Heterorhabditis bacteriophora]